MPQTLRKLGVKTELVGDTAGAAKALREHPDPTRVLAPALAAEIYGLEILMREVEDELAAQHHPIPGYDRRS